MYTKIRIYHRYKSFKFCEYYILGEFNNTSRKQRVQWILSKIITQPRWQLRWAVDMSNFMYYKTKRVNLSATPKICKIDFKIPVHSYDITIKYI